jgi:hypothetical protein
MTAREEEIVTMLKELRDRIDCIQRSQAALRPDIVGAIMGQIVRLLIDRWKDEDTRKREATWYR